MAEFTLHGQRSEVRISRYQPDLGVSVDGRTRKVLTEPSDSPDRFALVIGDTRVTGYCREDEDRVYLRFEGRTHILEKHEAMVGGMVGAVTGEIRAELPGNLATVHCEVGDTVRKGDLVLMTTSMKMEVPVHAPEDGEVAAVLVEPGQAFERGTPLVRITPA